MSALAVEISATTFLLFLLFLKFISQQKMDPNLSRLYVLFDFDDKSPGVGHASSIFKPSLPMQDLDDCLTLLKSWITSQKVLVVK